MNNRQKNKLVKYALIAFVLYLVWRKMSSGYEMAGSTSTIGRRANELSNIGSDEYCLKTTGTTNCMIAEKAGMKIGSVKAGEIGLKSDALRFDGARIGIDSAKPKCRIEALPCPVGKRLVGNSCVRTSWPFIITARPTNTVCDPVPVKEEPKCRIEKVCD